MTSAKASTAPSPPSREARLAAVEALRQTAAARGQAAALRQPPAAPTTCCGRGCNGCVWEGYDAALAAWLEDAAVALPGHAAC